MQQVYSKLHAEAAPLKNARIWHVWISPRASLLPQWSTSSRGGRLFGVAAMEWARMLCGSSSDLDAADVDTLYLYSIQYLWCIQKYWIQSISDDTEILCIILKYSLNISVSKDSSVHKLPNRHNSLSSSFPTNNHLPTSCFFSSVSPIKHQRLRLLHTPEEPPRLTPSSELNNKMGLCSSCTCRIACNKMH